MQFILEEQPFWEGAEPNFADLAIWLYPIWPCMAGMLAVSMKHYACSISDLNL